MCVRAACPEIDGKSSLVEEISDADEYVERLVADRSEAGDSMSTLDVRDDDDVVNDSSDPDERGEGGKTSWS